jgi:multiple sugar transport system permease protein
MARRLLSWILITAVLVLTLAPFLWLVMLAFKPAADIAALPPHLLFTPSLEHFTALLHSDFVRSFGNSLVTGTMATAAAMLLGVPAAYVLARMERRVADRIGFLILVSRMVPPIAFAVPFFLAYRWSGLLDTLTGLSLVYLTFSLSLVVWMLQPFFAAVPTALEEAASIDGAGPWQTFLGVVLPLAVPGLAATAILCFLYAWNDFFFALVLTRTEARTAPVAVVGLMNYEGWEWGKIAAGSVLVMAPVLVFSVAVRRFLVHGLTAGAVKG